MAPVPPSFRERHPVLFWSIIVFFVVAVTLSITLPLVLKGSSSPEQTEQQQEDESVPEVVENARVDPFQGKLVFSQSPEILRMTGSLDGWHFKPSTTSDRWLVAFSDSYVARVLYPDDYDASAIYSNTSSSVIRAANYASNSVTAGFDVTTAGVWGNVEFYGRSDTRLSYANTAAFNVDGYVYTFNDSRAFRISPGGTFVVWSLWNEEYNGIRSNTSGVTALFVRNGSKFSAAQLPMTTENGLPDVYADINSDNSSETIYFPRMAVYASAITSRRLYMMGKVNTGALLVVYVSTSTGQFLRESATSNTAVQVFDKIDVTNDDKLAIVLDKASGTAKYMKSDGIKWDLATLTSIPATNVTDTAVSLQPGSTDTYQLITAGRASIDMWSFADDGSLYPARKIDLYQTSGLTSFLSCSISPSFDGLQVYARVGTGQSGPSQQIQLFHWTGDDYDDRPAFFTFEKASMSGTFFGPTRKEKTGGIIYNDAATNRLLYYTA